ncbi:MAG: PqqD family peptide modification chaperone [Phycisphaerae bacterium]
MGLFGKKEKRIPRSDFLKLRPMAVTNVEITPRDDGGIDVETIAPRSGFLGFMFRDTVPKKYEFDQLGKEVFEACDGKKRLSALAKDLAKRHNITQAEAELSVISFVRTLADRSLVVFR